MKYAPGMRVIIRDEEWIKGLFIRRFKKDILDQAQDGFKERHIAEVPCTATPQEEAALEAFLIYEFHGP